MRLAKRKRLNSVSMNMTPMIDIVFQLLIFFMTVTQVSKINSEQLDLPVQEGTEDQSSSPVTINVTATGTIIVSGNAISVPELAATLSDQIGQQGGDPGRMVVVLRADRRGTSRTVNQVVSALNRLGISRVRIAVHASE